MGHEARVKGGRRALTDLWLRAHARIGAELASKGTPVGAHDLIIAATAVAIDSGVATRDVRSFPKIAGITLKRW